MLPEEDARWRKTRAISAGQPRFSAFQSMRLSVQRRAEEWRRDFRAELPFAVDSRRGHAPCTRPTEKPGLGLGLRTREACRFTGDA